MDATTRKVAVSAWAALRNVVLNDEDQRKRVSRALGITYFKIKVLLRLLDGSVSASQLVQDLASDKTYISLILRDLEADGTVERVISPVDRRYKEIALTVSGRELAKKALKILDQPPEGFSRLTPDEVNALLQLVNKISAAANPVGKDG